MKNMIYNRLKELGIDYEEISHKPIFTIKDAENIKEEIAGIGTKSLFLTNHKNKYYLYLIVDNKKADLKLLKKVLKESNLSLAGEFELKSILNLERGSVSPLGIINDKENTTELLIDKDLYNKRILCHPNINTKTISISYSNLIKLIESEKHKYMII